ncbi:MAG: D-alanyl-D-alanine carboxypeptidase, partial [Bacillota bacterium]
MFKRACGFSLVLFMLILLGSGGPVQAQLTFDIPAEIGLLMEASTGRILWAKNPDMQTEPASLAKMMTMLLVYEAVENGIATWNDRVVASR